MAAALENWSISRDKDCEAIIIQCMLLEYQISTAAMRVSLESSIIASVLKPGNSVKVKCQFRATSHAV